ncbi:MAG TPA: endonuclease V [Streptosporangiaceae bacterium]
MFAAVDVCYPASGGACAAAVLAGDAAFAEVTDERTAWLPDVVAYEPGEFYRRELPALRAVLTGVVGLSQLIIDGYVDLDAAGRPGLGAHAHAEFGVPVIGVAKTAFHTATHAIPVLRGLSARPLYVTAIGLSLADAADQVRTMTGRFRLPDAIRRADALGRSAVARPAAGLDLAR